MIRIDPALFKGARHSAAPGMGVSAGSDADTVPSQGFLLRRSGERPLRFTGMLLAAHEETSETGARLAIRLYETTGSTFVIEINHHDERKCAVPHAIAREVSSPEEAADVFKSFDPRRIVDTSRLAAALRGEATLETELGAIRKALEVISRDYLTLVHKAVGQAATTDDILSGAV
jgi:hypothetical protein